MERNPEEELQAISYLLEALDAEFTELQDTIERATDSALARGYFPLAATMQEITSHVIRYRIDMIGWGLAMGLTGQNTEDVLEDIVEQGVKRLPDTYHPALKEALANARAFIKPTPA